MKYPIARVAEFFRVVTATAKNGTWATDHTVRERFAICIRCVHMELNDDNTEGKCGMCKCQIRDEKAKTFRTRLTNKLAHPSSRCPRGWWAEEEA